MSGGPIVQCEVTVNIVRFVELRPMSILFLFTGVTLLQQLIAAAIVPLFAVFVLLSERSAMFLSATCVFYCD